MRFADVLGEGQNLLKEKMQTFLAEKRQSNPKSFSKIQNLNKNVIKNSENQNFCGILRYQLSDADVKGMLEDVHKTIGSSMQNGGA